MEGNHFTRSASDKIVVTASNIGWLNADTTYQPITIGESVQRQVGRQIGVEFLDGVVIQNNIFDVSDGVLMHNMNDGETINNEGGATEDQQDAGTATSATSTTITGQSKTWNYVPSSAYNAGSMIAVISGTGWGQWRQIISLSNNTFTVSPAWDITPAAGDNFAIFVPSMQNSLIRTNTMSDNPRGILLYAAGFYNSSIINNTLTDNGGIWLESIQDTANEQIMPSPKVGSFRNIEVNGNTVTNTLGLYPAYINIVATLHDPNYTFGTAFDSIEVRNNSVTAIPGTPPYDFPDGGYMNSLSYTDGAAPYSPNGTAYGIVGTILEGNSCTSCPNYAELSTGVSDTIIWNSIVNGVSTPTPTTFNLKYSNTPGAVGTVTGSD